jgi:hypothetical protein
MLLVLNYHMMHFRWLEIEVKNHNQQITLIDVTYES